MENCCFNDLGNFPHSSDINTGLIAPMSGIYEINIEFNGAIISKQINTLLGDQIIIKRPFPENYLLKFSITDPNGLLMEVEDCSNFKLKTFINTNSNCNGNICDDDAQDSMPYYDGGY